jgi:predicted transcriptional regulator
VPLARKAGLKMMQQAIQQYMDVKCNEKRESFSKDALEAWEEFQATGMHATADEVEKWLASWGTDSELSTPLCHQKEAGF